MSNPTNQTSMESNANTLMHDYIEKMTLDEKIAQLIQLAVPFFEGAEGGGLITGPMASLGITEQTVRNSGIRSGYGRSAGGH